MLQCLLGPDQNLLLSMVLRMSHEKGKCCVVLAFIMIFPNVSVVFLSVKLRNCGTDTVVLLLNFSPLYDTFKSIRNTFGV